MTSRLVELARLRVPCRASAEAIRTTARAIGCDVEVRAIGACGFLVVVEGLHAPSPMLAEGLELLARGAA